MWGGCLETPGRNKRVRSPREGGGLFGLHHSAGTQDSRNMNYLLVEGAKATGAHPGAGLEEPDKAGPAVMFSGVRYPLDRLVGSPTDLT